MIELVVGPMFSGKTQELLRRMERCRVAGMKCLMIKWIRDDRYSKDKIVSHGGVDSDITTVKVSNLKDVDAEPYTVIGIDEGQFYSDIDQVTDTWACAGKRVIIASLDMTFEGIPFGNIYKIVPERLTKLTAVCKGCLSDNAIFSHRIVEGEGEELVGGSESYMPLCRLCFHKLK